MYYGSFKEFQDIWKQDYQEKSDKFIKKINSRPRRKRGKRKCQKKKLY